MNSRDTEKKESKEKLTTELTLTPLLKVILYKSELFKIAIMINCHKFRTSIKKRRMD